MWHKRAALPVDTLSPLFFTPASYATNYSGAQVFFTQSTIFAGL